MSTLRVTQARVMKSEWTKLRTQPGALWSLLSAVILVVAFGILYSLLRVARPPHGAAVASFDPTSVSLAGVQLAQIAAGVLGVLLITSEYATGLIRTTLAAVPRRLPTLWGKAAVLTAAVIAVSVPAAVAVFLAGQSILGRQHLSVSLGDPGVARAVIGSALYLAVAGLLGLALGALLRSTAGGIAALFGLLFAIPIVVGFLPGSLSDEIGKYLPGAAGLAVTSVHPDPATSLAPWTGFGVFCAYAVVLLGSPRCGCGAGMRSCSAGSDGQLLRRPRIRRRADREGQPDAEAVREGPRGLRRAAGGVHEHVHQQVDDGTAEQFLIGEEGPGPATRQIVNANQVALNSAVQQYKAAYARELKKLSSLLRTAKANAFPHAVPTSTR